MTEQQGTQSRIMEAFDSICAQEVGNTLRNIIDHYDLSHQDKKSGIAKASISHEGKEGLVYFVVDNPEDQLVLNPQISVEDQ
ncbi:hypothetical protein PT115_09300, partial [Erysipelothrix rhusiopathiae]|nr:hypothetical protein [Erysipelothrix rhusiopathiae]